MFINQKFLIVFDLDGTLLTSKKTISKKTKEYIKYLISQGHFVTMASGRPIRAIKPFYEEIGSSLPFIGYNGSIIVNKDYDVLFEKKYKKEIVKNIFSHFSTSIFDNEQAEDKDTLYFLREDKNGFEQFFHSYGINVKYGPIEENIKEDVYSALFTLKDEKYKKMIYDLVSTYEDLGVRYWFDAELSGELFFYSINKSTAIDRVQKMYNIDRAHTISFGDADNDIDMIKKAGIGFVMKNGSPSLKQVATYVTEYDNDHDGIYYALKEFFER